jgi:prepilin-type N-terminal cleavage/methylation domain-containing protein
MRRPRTKGFTLIEMLTVIVIVGIVLGITIPAVTNLMKSGGLNAASREVSNTLGLARQLAITQRTYARVVFPYSATPVAQRDMWYRTYAVMTNRVNTAAANWRYASKWEYLPIGVTFWDFVPAVGQPASGALDDVGVSLNDQPGLPFPDAKPGNIGRLAYIEFGPTGAATPVPPASTTPSILTLTEGFVSSGKPTPTSKNTSGGLLNVGTITVNSLVGRIQVTRP